MKKKAAVFISAGLGDAILMIPLLKKLREEGQHITGIFTSPFPCEELFVESRLFDEKIILRGNKIKVSLLALWHAGRFGSIYMNVFASTRKNILLAHLMGKEIISNHIPPALPGSRRKKINFTAPVKGLHDAAQNLRLLNSTAANKELDEELIAFDVPLSAEITPGTVLVQPSSGKGTRSYKNWPVEHWITFLQQASAEFPHLRFILLGDEDEKSLAEQIMKASIPRVESRVGNTGIAELMKIIGNCSAFIGNDGGLMHMAAAFKKPTCTLWGPTDFNLYGYHMINPEKHTIVYNAVDCRPCDSWIDPNTSRVKNPADCPDKKCMKELLPLTVYTAFRKFATLNLSHAE